MPITARALIQYPRGFRQCWQSVNRDFEAVRQVLHEIYRETRPTRTTPLREMDHWLNEYARLRGVLYGLLPQVEEREG